MSLTRCKKKRNLKKSGEPAAKKKSTVSRKLAFVIQEHDASHLHWDLRLEWDGVLKSWAVPKKPSSTLKRLAIHVEDHPYDYKDFEGEIPYGYGAGTISIWDKGTYSVHDADAKESEKLMRQGFKKGVLHFTLKGKRLKGEFLLIRLKQDKQWLFFKKR